MRRSFILSAALMVLLMAMAPSALAANRALVVGNDPEECPEATFTSIQAAVTAADPGSTIRVCPGTYREMVTVAKNDLRIVGMDEPNDVTVEGRPDDPNQAQEAGFLVHNVSGVLIQGFTVRGFHEADILLVSANGNVIRNNRTTKSAHDGIQLNSSSDNLIENNVSFDNDATLPARAFTDACGVLLRLGSSNNTIRRNELFGNAFGILIAGGSNSNVVSRNDSHDNRRYGIRNLSNAGTLIRGNEVEHNIVSSLGPGRGVSVEASTNVTVTNNEASDNTPDLFWDGSGSNSFKNNECDTSQPPGLCETNG
jgi:parallel beta-helix repeat protein